MKSRWGIGIFLGVTRKSHEYIVGTPFGVHKCGTVQRMAPSARWNLERLNQMRGAPWHWRAEEEAEVEAPVAKAAEQPEAEA